MIYEFHDDNNGTAEEKRDKAKDWLVKYYKMTPSKERGFMYRDCLVSNSGNQYDFFTIKVGAYPNCQLGLSVENAGFYEWKSVNVLEKVFINFETCCDMFDRGVMK